MGKIRKPLNQDRPFSAPAASARTHGSSREQLSGCGGATGWGVAANANYLYMGGTSMSCPLVAGATLLIRLADRIEQDGPAFAQLESLNCGKPLAARLGKHGRFVGCTGYPDCDYTRDLGSNNRPEQPPQVVEGRECPKCGAPLILRQGKYGPFLGCSAYPQCRHIEPVDKPEDTGVACPQCRKGTLRKRKSRRGKVFYGCSEFASTGCDFVAWDRPVATPCPECGADNRVSIDPYFCLGRVSQDLFGDIHRLASHYHWSEAEILAMPRWRRQRYLALIDRSRGMTQ